MLVAAVGYILIGVPGLCLADRQSERPWNNLFSVADVQEVGRVPVTWSISREDRSVLVTLGGKVQAEDIQRFISNMFAEGLEADRKLVDARCMTPGGLRLSDLKAFSTMIVARTKEKPMGPFAFVIGSDLEREMAEVYGQEAWQRRGDGWTGRPIEPRFPELDRAALPCPDATSACARALWGDIAGSKT